jgi:hypothetical protein
LATQHTQGEHQGRVKDPEHDGRLKENREAGRTKGTTPGSEARAEHHGHEPGRGSGQDAGDHQRHHSGSRESEHVAHTSGSGEGSDDLKSREYRDEKGEVHHHTRTYQEQHGKKS